VFESIIAFSEGWRFHIRGIRFGFGHPSFLILSIVPFLITLALYSFAFYMFALYADDLLRMIWHVEAGEFSPYVGWLYGVCLYVIKFFLYLIVLVVMFYTFIVVSNVLASPVYDYISKRYEQVHYQNASREQATSSAKGMLTVMKEEVKKAMLMIAIPLPLLLIPVAGTVLSFIVAGAFIAWAYIDFSLSRDYPLLKDRIKAVWRYKFILLGFGCPLLVPFLGLIIMPFAILGSTKLYFDRMRETPLEIHTTY
jgi:CysZ protein